MSLLNLLLAGAGLGAGFQVGDETRTAGETAQTEASALGKQLADDTEFTGYGFTTGLGTGSVGTDGTTTFGAGPDTAMQTAAGTLQSGAGTGFGSAMTAAQGVSNPYLAQAYNQMLAGSAGLGAQQSGALTASQQAMQNAMMSPAQREQAVYNRAMAMQQPALDAAQAQQQAREYAMGRSGVRGSQFGGTAEDAAMARARAQASNQAAFQAMGQAQQEMMNQGTLASQFGQMGLQSAGTQNQIGTSMGNLGQAAGQLDAQSAGIMAQIAAQQGQLGNQMYQSSFMPLQTQIQAAQTAAQNAAMAQTGQLSGAGYEAQLGLGGLQALINAQTGAAQSDASVLSSALSAMGQATSGIGSSLAGVSTGNDTIDGLINLLLGGGSST